MDFSKQFEQLFPAVNDFSGQAVGLNTKLQETRHALQEATSENDALTSLINTLYKESLVEITATTELISQVPNAPFKTISHPRNPDNISLSEKAGYVVYSLKFHGFATRKITEDFHNMRDNRDSLKKVVEQNTVKLEVKRSGAIKLPELAGQQEVKRSVQTESPPSPPATPPKSDERDSSSTGDAKLLKTPVSPTPQNPEKRPAQKVQMRK